MHDTFQTSCIHDKLHVLKPAIALLSCCRSGLMPCMYLQTHSTCSKIKYVPIHYKGSHENNQKVLTSKVMTTQPAVATTSSNGQGKRVTSSQVRQLPHATSKASSARAVAAPSAATSAQAPATPIAAGTLATGSRPTSAAQVQKVPQQQMLQPLQPVLALADGSPLATAAHPHSISLSTPDQGGAGNTSTASTTQTAQELAADCSALHLAVADCTKTMNLEAHEAALFTHHMMAEKGRQLLTQVEQSDRVRCTILGQGTAGLAADSSTTVRGIKIQASCYFSHTLRLSSLPMPAGVASAAKVHVHQTA